MKRMTLLTLAGAALAVWASQAAEANPEAAMAKAGCTACHAKEAKMVGPAYKVVAAKYKGQPDAAKTLAAKVRAGGKGVYGQIPMPPHPADKISDADLAAAVDYILKQ